MLGVANYALWAAGCAFPKPAAEPISRWELDETSSAEGVFEDRGPAHVLMVHVGDWADLTTGSLVEGDDDTSAYTDGAAYATMPANVAAHNLAALTISLYYQRAAAADKHILLAAGDGSAPGDFSLEVLANGRLRAWHTGQDGMLRFFEDTSGITGTNLQVGTAHRIELSLGLQGARLYLDGAELAAAAIAENSNGWNNARVKYLGRWSDGVAAPAVGVFDRLRIWNRQLTGAEIAELAPAQSITLPEPEPGEPGQPGDAPLAPSLAEWLVSDEADPPVTKYVSNQNRGNGSGASPADAQEVQAALNSASPGAVLLAVCQTPGTIEFWNYPNGLTFPNGSANNYITLQARQGDGAVISRGEDFAGARTPGSGFWTQSGLSGDDISKNIWRSVGTFPGGEQTMMGWWIEFDQPHQIIRAGNMTNLRAPRTAGLSPGGDSPATFGGPAVHKASDGRVYIRMENGHPDKYSFHQKWSPNTWEGYPQAVSNGVLVYPLSNNPNDYEIYLTRQTSGQAFTVGQWNKIGAGINSMGFRECFSSDSAHIWIDRGLHYTCVTFNRSTNPPISDVFCHRVRASDGSKIHLSRAEWKFGGHLEGIRSVAWSMFNTASLDQIYCLDCTFGHYHELMVGNAGLDQIRFRNCTFISILDDGLQAKASMSRMEFGYCYYLNSAFGGFGAGGDDGDPVGPSGNWFFHHNIVDCRQERCTDWMSEPHPGFMYGSHSPDGNMPIKFYNNLFLYGPDLEVEGMSGLSHNDAGGGSSGENNTATGAANMHEVFNNILMRVFLEGTKRYDPAAGNNYTFPPQLQNQTDFVLGRCIKYSADFTNEMFDYNLYWRPAAMTTDPWFRGYRRGAGSSGGAVSNYATLAAWRNSSEFEHSKQAGSRRGAYPPGFDGNSTDQKPTMGTIDNYPAERFTGYRPAPTSAVTVAASGSLSGADWWTSPPTWGDDYFPWNDGPMTLRPEAWKGALDPNGEIVPVGVQNP